MVARLSVARADDAAQVAAQQRDSRAFDGHVRSGAHGDADVGLRQRGGIVHAVARHGDDAPFRLQALYDFAFLSGQNPGMNFVDVRVCARRLPRWRGCRP